MNRYTLTIASGQLNENGGQITERKSVEASGYEFVNAGEHRAFVEFYDENGDGILATPVAMVHFIQRE